MLRYDFQGSILRGCVPLNSRKAILIAALLAGTVAPVAVNAQLNPPEVPQADAGLGLLSYERYLEESLDRGLSAYLGADRFIVQVKAVLREPENRMPRGGYAPQQLPVPSFGAPVPSLPTVSAGEQEADEPPLLPGLAFAPETPVRDVPRATLPAPAPVPLPVAEAPREAQIERLRVGIVLPSTLTSKDEDFIRNMVMQKVDHQYARNLDVEITRRDFPSVPGAPAPGPVVPAWGWALLAAGVGLGLGWLLFRSRRGSAPMSTGAAAPAMSLASMTPEVKGPSPEAARHELTMLLLSEPELAERYMGQLLGQDLGMDRAAILMRALGSGVSRRLFPGVSEEIWRAIELKQYERDDLSAEETLQALNEAVRSIVRDRHTGGPRAAARRNEPFAFLETLDDSQILYILQDESPRVQALLYSQLSPQRAIGLMQLLNPGELGGITAAMGELSEIPLETYGDIALHLAGKASEAPRFSTSVTNGIGILVGLLDHSDREMEKRILQELSTQNPQMLKQVKQSYVAFDDLPRVPREALRDALRDFPKEQLAEVLRDASADVVSAIMGALNERGRQIVEEALKGPSLLETNPEARDTMRRELLNRIRQTSRTLVIPQAGGR
jgi:flagellar motor switch protein FliG